MKDNNVLSLNSERFKELNFDSMSVNMKACFEEVAQRLNAICEAEDPFKLELKLRESDWLELASGLRKHLASVLHDSVVFLDDGFETFRAFLFAQATGCPHRDAAEFFSALRDRVLEAALASIGVHEKVMADCAACVRGEFAEVSLTCSEQKACWELVGKDEVC